MPNSDVLATTTQFTVLAALQRWLADVVDVEEVRIANVEEQLHVDVAYTRLDSGTRLEERFEAPGVR
jgi:hypothetical protein